MMEKQPQMRLSRQACLKASTSGPSTRHMISGFVSMDRPWSEYSGKTTRSIVERLRRALPTISTMRAVWRFRSSGVATVGSCSCTQPMTTPLSDLFNPPRPFMPGSYFVMESSRGAPSRARRGEEVRIRMRRVRT